MTTSELIEKYFDNHAGKSSHIDAQLRLADQAIKDAGRCQERGDNDYSVANLAIARSLITGLVEIITPFHNSLRNSLIEIYHSADNELCDLSDAIKKAH